MADILCLVLFNISWNKALDLLSHNDGSGDRRQWQQTAMALILCQSVHKNAWLPNEVHHDEDPSDPYADLSNP